jgi:hypothetical protein
MNLFNAAVAMDVPKACFSDRGSHFSPPGSRL